MKGYSMESKIETPYGKVYLNLDTRHVSLLLSGGFDSMVMLFLLAKTAYDNNLEVTIHPQTVGKVNTTSDQSKNKISNFPYVDNAIYLAKKHFPTVKILDKEYILSYNSWMQKSKPLLEAQRTITWGLYNKIQDDTTVAYKVVNYNGVTRNPPIVVGNEGENPEKHRNKKVLAYEDTVSLVTNHEKMLFVEPFRNSDKRITFWLADNLGILNDVLLLSRSCEGNQDLTDHGAKECKWCWWCCEREWAMKEYKNYE